MTLLAPLGLLGLLGIVALIIIYIIKPNYQQKYISSTYVWKLSLKYRKKRIPVSKLRNILLIVCQILILTACASILAKPVKILLNKVEEREVIAILDASASMRTTLDGETRFERAVGEVLELSEEVWAKDGIVSVIYAEDGASFLAERVTSEYKQTLTAELEKLLTGEDIACSYATADVDGAMTLCEEVLFENPNAEIFFYTDMEYDYVPEGITVKDLSEDAEWNAAILDAYTEYSDGYYTFFVEVACYGRDKEIEVRLEVQNANADNINETGAKKVFTQTVPCDGERTKTVVFINEDLYQQDSEMEDVVYFKIPGNNDKDDRIYSYQTINVSILESDSFTVDNTFQIYGGQKEVVKIQYASTNPNPFYGVVLNNLANAYKHLWDIQVTEVKRGDHEGVKTSGFDFYLFEEEEIPEKLPTDGVVVLLDPQKDKLPAGTGITITKVMESKSGEELTEGEMHPIMNNILAENIEVTRYTEIVYDSDFIPLMYCNSKPVVAVKDEAGSKMVVVGFSIHYSTFAIRKEFPLFMYNLFGHFMPPTVEQNDFEVNETVKLNARGLQLEVKREGSADMPTVYNQFPASMQVALPGTYSLKQVTYSGTPVTEYVYVHIAATESNIHAKGDTVKEPERTRDDSEYFKDLIFFVAAAMVALLFIEWWLQSRENM
jgi:hypothetical protein